MLGEQPVELVHVEVVLVILAEAVHREAVRLAKRHPHFTELAVAAHRQGIARRKEVADRGFHCTAAGRVYRQDWTSCPEKRLQQLHHLSQLTRKLWRAMMQHGPCARRKNALRYTRWARSHHKQRADRSPPPCS